jgi:hypothetical protein
VTEPAADPGVGADIVGDGLGDGARLAALREPRRWPSREQVVAFARLGRPRFLLNSLLLVTLGLSVAVYQGRRLDWAGWVLVQLFAWCTHLMTHYCNEYFERPTG